MKHILIMLALASPLAASGLPVPKFTNPSANAIGPCDVCGKEFCACGCRSGGVCTCLDAKTDPDYAEFLAWKAAKKNRATTHAKWTAEGWTLNEADGCYYKYPTAQPVQTYQSQPVQTYQSQPVQTYQPQYFGGFQSFGGGFGGSSCGPGGCR